MITGGDTVSARFLHHEFFEFKPQCKLWLVCNDAPRASDTDDALWRRIIRVPFEYTIPKDERDPQVKATLKDPAIGGPAVLAWIVQGCAKWKSTGLTVPYAIEQATQDYRDSQDPLKEFFDEWCIFEADAKVPVKELRAAYEKYSQEAGIRYPLGPREFNKRLEARECRRTTTKYTNPAGTIYEDIKCWMGVRLATAADKEPAPDADSTQCDTDLPF
jgi:putative DNA primase/helicase